MAKLETVGEDLHVDGKRVLKGWEDISGGFHLALEDLGDMEVVVDAKSMETAVGRQYFGFVQLLEEEFGEFNTAYFEPLIKKGMMWPIRDDDLPYAGRRS